MNAKPHILGILNPDDYPKSQQKLVKDFNTKLLALNEENARLTMTVSQKDQRIQNSINGTSRVYNINLTKNLIEDEIYDYSKGVEIAWLKELGFSIPTLFDAFVKKTLETVVCDKSKEAYKNHFNREHLLKAYENGDCMQTLEYESYSLKFRDVHTIRHSILLTKEQETSDVIAMCSARDITNLVKSNEQLDKAKELNEENFYVMEGLLRDFSSVWIVNHKTLNIRLFRENNSIVLKEAIKQAKKNPFYSDFMESFIKNYVAQRDQERLLNDIKINVVMENLEKDELYTINFCQIDEKNNETYHRIAFTGMNENNFICAFKDVDSIVRNEIKSTERKARIKQYESDFSTLELLHDALNSGSWSMTFDENGKMTSCSWSSTFRRILGYKNEEDFPNRLESWLDLIYGEDREPTLKKFWDTINDYSGKLNYDVQYRLYTKNQGLRWFHALGRLSRREDGSPIKFAGLFTDIQEKFERDSKEKEQNEIVNALSRDYLNIFKVDMKTHSGQIIKLDGYVTKGINDYKNKVFPYDAMCRQYVKYRVFKDDMEPLLEAMNLETVQKKLAEGKEYNYNYRISDNGEIHYYQFKYIRLEEDNPDSNIIAAFKNIDDVVQAKKERESLLYLSKTDQMTKLLNKSSGQKQVSNVLSRKQGGMFCIFDIDYFKRLNDTYGHKAGDDVIVGIANIIKETFRDEDIKYRLGGDEFAVYVPNLFNEDLALLVIKRFIKNLKSMILSSVNNEEIFISIGAGIVMPEKFISFENLYKLVDTGVYESKKVIGRSTVTFVDIDRKGIKQTI